MKPCTSILLPILLALGTAVAVLDARLLAIAPTACVVLPLTTTERIPHVETEELEAVPRATRVPVTIPIDDRVGFELRFVEAIGTTANRLEPAWSDGDPRWSAFAFPSIPDVERLPLFPGAHLANNDEFVSPARAAPADAVHVVSVYSLGVHLRETFGGFETPVRMWVCPTSTDEVPNETDEWLR